MRVLLVGSGGREHALAWAIRRSASLERLDCAPGNAGTARIATTVALTADDVEALGRHAVSERYDLVVIGPEAPLVAGLADRLRDAGIAVFGPSAGAAAIEGSKSFAKEFMGRHGIPTASYRVFDDADSAERYLFSSEAEYPLVVKADGLAAGKGVVMADDCATAVDAAKGMLEGDRFGAAGRRVVVEERLRGREASVFVLTDGDMVRPLATCQDYKRVGDGDAGPNTGGMGSYSPSVWLDDATLRSVVDTIAVPTIRGLAEEGRRYRGVLYVGLMLTERGPRVLEYNARFGDPETQALIPRLDGDWLPLLAACASGSLADAPSAWRTGASVCVVMASRGYPGAYEKGVPIDGIAEAESIDGVAVFHAGTAPDGRQGFVTSGGRVLGVTATAGDLAAARDLAYEAVGRIRWAGEHHRTDIALDAVRRSREERMR